MPSKLATKAIISAITLKGNGDVKTLLNNCANATKVNKDLLMKLLRDNQDTEYGKKYHFADIKSVEDYQRMVPLSDFDDYAPYIERMVEKGEKNLITAYDIVQYAETSGTIGVPKKIPVSKHSMKIYANYTISRVTSLANKWHKEHSGHGLPTGRGLNQLEIVDRYLKDGTPLGNISGSAAKSYKALFPYYLTSPIPVLYPKRYMPMTYLKLIFALKDRDMSFMFSVFMSNLVDMMSYLQANWESIVQDIRTGSFNEDLNIDPEVIAELKPFMQADPERAAEIEKECKKGFDTPIIPRLWKKMSFICSIGTGGFAAYTEKMRSFSGDVPIDFSIYGASEAMMAACLELEKPEFALLCDSCFFEFIPAEVDDVNSYASPLTIDQLEVGKDYEIIITNLSGFYRYRIKDVITVLGYKDECPLISFSHRKSQLLDIAGDKITEAMANNAIKQLGEELGVIIMDYCVYMNRELSPPRYEFIIEADKELDPSKCGEYAAALDRILGSINPVYKECLDTTEISPMVLYLQQQQTHLLWRDLLMQRGTSSNQAKPVRVLDSPKKKNFFFKMIEEPNNK